MAKKFDYQGARNEGYSDEEISKHLSELYPKFDYQGAIESGYSPSEINEHLSEYKSGRSKLEKTARVGAQYAIGNVERLAAPYDIAVAPLASKKAQQVPYRENLFADIERLQEQKQMGQWDKQDQELYDSLVEQAGNTKKSEKFVKTADISSGNLINKGSKALGYDLTPEGIEEHVGRIGGNLFSPKGLKNGVNAGKNFLNKESREAAKLESKWKYIDRTVKGNPEKENILNFAKSKNLNPEETTLILQTNGKIENLEKIAKKSKKYKEISKGLSDKLGEGYEELKFLGKQSGHLAPSEKGALQGDLQKILNKIEKTYVEGPDTKGARLEIEEAIKKIGEKEGTIEDLINSRQNINQVVNWKNVDPKGALLEDAKNALFKAIQRKNPDIASELKKTDSAWAKYKKFSKSLNKKEPGISIHGIKLPAGMMSSLAFAGALKFALGASLPATIKGIAVKEVVQRLSTKLLTDPKYQSIHRHIQHAVRSGATNNQKSLFAVLKNMIKKDDPELYDEISDFVVD